MDLELKEKRLARVNNEYQSKMRRDSEYFLYHPVDEMVEEIKKMVENYKNDLEKLKNFGLFDNSWWERTIEKEKEEVPYRICKMIRKNVKEAYNQSTHPWERKRILNVKKLILKKLANELEPTIM